MIALLSGTVVDIQDLKIIVTVSGVGFELSCPSAVGLKVQSTVILYTYLHWSQEDGPSLYGFEQSNQKKIFMLLISCQGIGPKLALSILTQSDVSMIVSMIMQQDHQGLSKLKGLGAKKAEILCMQLKDKVQNLTLADLNIDNQQARMWQDLQQTLQSLNYSSTEIKQVTAIIQKDMTAQNVSFDLLLRKSLQILAKK